MKKIKVFLAGGDNHGWALDDDLHLTRRSLESFVEFTDINDCDYVHLVWWEPLKHLSPKLLNGKQIICHIPGEPFRYYSIPGYSRLTKEIDYWITQSHQAKQQMESLRTNSYLIPYSVDTEIFRPLSERENKKNELLNRWNIPINSYLIGSFQRDTEGIDLISPKLVKGPDIFLEIVDLLKKRGNQIHIVLAGPRRAWLRKKLDERGISYTYIGTTTNDGVDDYKINTLPHEELNILYNLIDLYLVSSRSEGGPRSILEASAAGCKVLSTKVGISMDILDPLCSYNTPLDAVEIVERDIKENLLKNTVDVHLRRIQQTHTLIANHPLFRSLYENISLNFAGVSASRPQRSSTRRNASLFASVFLRLLSNKKTSLKVSLWHEFVAPPFGGGNQFMLALKYALKKRGVIVVENQISPDVTAYILNAVRFDIKLFRRWKSLVRNKVIHRIDGPISLARGIDRKLDDLCFSLNREFASTTILQSAWTYKALTGMGYLPVNPVIVNNFVNPNVFHPVGRVGFDLNRKVRLISTSWSNNERKGGKTYKWLDQNLDWDRFEYTFVGNVSEDFENIRVIPAVSSEKLAEILRQHDIYIFASRIESFSNALLEGLASGLPAIYYNGSSNPEVVGYGGLPFKDASEIPLLLDSLVKDYSVFQNLISVPTIESIVDKYISMIKTVGQI